MLSVIDNIVAADDLMALRRLCELHGELKEQHDGPKLFSWNPYKGTSKTIHSPASQMLFEHYLVNYLKPYALPYLKNSVGAEWWCNVNNDLGWHIDKDENLMNKTGQYSLPELSSVFYPYIHCAGGELLLADNTTISNGYIGPLPEFKSVISVPPVENRLVLFSSGIMHMINKFEGDRYSIAANFWPYEPNS